MAGTLPGLNISNPVHFQTENRPDFEETVARGGRAGAFPHPRLRPAGRTRPGWPRERQKNVENLLFPLDTFLRFIIFISQSESVTLSVDYLISSAQAGRATCLGFFMWYDSPLKTAPFRRF